jgi:O-antigen/teichoic acid export membrane protein
MLLSVLAAPFVARLFSPQDYGIAALFLAMVTIGACVLPLGYQRAVLFPREDRVAERLLALALTTIVSLTLVAYAALGVAALVWPELLGATVTFEVTWLVPLGAMLFSTRDAMNTLLLRLRAFSTMAGRDVAEAAVLASTRIGWGFAFDSSAVGLVLGQLVSLVVAICVSWRVCGAALRAAMRKLSWAELSALASEYKDYPRFRVFAHLAFVVANQLPVLALSMMFDSAVVGFFAMANRVVGLPLRAVSQSLSDAILRRTIGHRHQDRPVAPGIWKATLVLTVTGIPTFSFIFLFGSDVLTWVLGARWYEAGRMLEILTLYLLLFWLSTAFFGVFDALRANRPQLILDSIGLLARIVSFAVCHVLGLDVYQTLWTFVLVGCLHQILVIGGAIIVLREHDRRRMLESR